MPMNPSLRKFTLTAHVATSVGWFGAVCVYLALAVFALNSADAQMVRAAYQFMLWLGWAIIVPFSLATMVAGGIQALGTKWGLVNHYWVLVKFVLTTIGAMILLEHMNAVGEMVDIARGTLLSVSDYRQLRMSLVVHPTGGALLLLSTTIISVYKPWGLTPLAVPGGANARPLAMTTALEPDSVFPTQTLHRPRWPLIVGAHAVALAMIAIIAHVALGGFRGH